MVFPVDTSSPDELVQAVKKLRVKWGRLDIVFANAGINGVWSTLDKLSVEEWRKTLSINLDGTFYTVRAALALLKVRGGSVIITSSVNGTRMLSNTGATAYAISKAGQVAFAKMIAVELARFRTRVNVVCPGAVATSIDDNTKRAESRIWPRRSSLPRENPAHG